MSVTHEQVHQRARQQDQERQEVQYVLPVLREKQQGDPSQSGRPSRPPTCFASEEARSIGLLSSMKAATVLRMGVVLAALRHGRAKRFATLRVLCLDARASGVRSEGTIGRHSPAPLEF